MEPKKQEASSVSTPLVEQSEAYTEEELRKVWDEFAEGRKLYHAEYHLLMQPYERTAHLITMVLHNPIQDTILANFKGDLTFFLRDKLKNSFITVAGELREEESKKVMYTPREKFQFLVEKNPMLRELKERLGLDTDF